MNKFFLLLTLVLLTLTGCGEQPAPRNPKPLWTINPNDGGVRGAVGIAGRTHDQRESTRRKYAITRALEELSLQQGVEVTMNVRKIEKVVNDRSSTRLDAESTFKTNNTVTAHIAGAWENKYTSELYIWMVMD